MTHSHSGPTRSLPRNPSLPQLRKQAKELLKAYLAGDDTAVAEVERCERNPELARFVLADAQRVLARAYGFSSWTGLKQCVDALHLEAFCRAAENGDVPTVLKIAGARPELVNPDSAEFRTSALHRAVLKRDTDMTRVLMELGADARRGFWPHRGATTAHTIAHDRGYDEIVEIIEREEDRRRRDSSIPGATISSKTDQIQQAILAGRSDEAIRILESDLSLIGACDIQGATPLHVAARAHNPELVAWLLDRQASVDARDAEGRTPLDHASIFAGWSANDRYYGWSGKNERFPFLENANIEPARFDKTVELLRSRGAELTPRAAVATGDCQAVLRMHRERRLHNGVHYYRGGLLAIAVRVNRIDMVSLLLDLDFDPDETATPTEDGGRSWGMPLWCAAMCGRHEIARLLLERGADVNAIVYACGDPLGNAEATRDERMQTLLREHGARLAVEGVANRGDLDTVKAILDGAIPAQSLNVDEPSITDLAEQMLWAAAGSYVEVVRLCLPHVARTRDDPWWAYVLLQATLPDTVRLLLQHGVDPNVAGEDGATPLHHLATDRFDDRNRQELARLLLDARASLNRRDALLQSTALGWACRWGCAKLVRLYLERGADALEADAEPWARPLAWAEKGGDQEIIEMLRSRAATLNPGTRTRSC